MTGAADKLAKLRKSQAPADNGSADLARGTFNGDAPNPEQLAKLRREEAQFQEQRQKKAVDVRLDEIEFDDRLQVRTGGLDKTQIAKLVAVLENGGEFDDPIDVFELPDGRKVVSSGFHRGTAKDLAGHETIQAIIHKGTWDDALRHAAKSNIEHDYGLALSKQDKQNVLKIMLQLGDWLDWSDGYIANVLGISHHATISSWIDQLVKNDELTIERPTKRLGADGKYREITKIVEAAQRPRVEVVGLAGIITIIAPEQYAPSVTAEFIGAYPDDTGRGAFEIALQDEFLIYRKWVGGKAISPWIPIRSDLSTTQIYDRDALEAAVNRYLASDLGNPEDLTRTSEGDEKSPLPHRDGYEHAEDSQSRQTPQTGQGGLSGTHQNQDDSDDDDDDENGAFQTYYPNHQKTTHHQPSNQGQQTTPTGNSKGFISGTGKVEPVQGTASTRFQPRSEMPRAEQIAMLFQWKVPEDQHDLLMMAQVNGEQWVPIYKESGQRWYPPDANTNGQPIDERVYTRTLMDWLGRLELAIVETPNHLETIIGIRGIREMHKLPSEKLLQFHSNIETLKEYLGNAETFIEHLEMLQEKLVIMAQTGKPYDEELDEGA